MNLRRPKDLVQSLHHGGNPLLCQRPYHTGEGRKGVCSGVVFRALRDLASDHGGTQGPLGPVVRRLDARVLQEAQQVAPVMLRADAVEQPLIVRIRQQPRAQMIDEGVPRCDAWSS